MADSPDPTITYVLFGVVIILQAINTFNHYFLSRIIKSSCWGANVELSPSNENSQPHTSHTIEMPTADNLLHEVIQATTK